MAQDAKPFDRETVATLFKHMLAALGIDFDNDIEGITSADQLVYQTNDNRLQITLKDDNEGILFLDIWLKSQEADGKMQELITIRFEEGTDGVTSYHGYIERELGQLPAGYVMQSAVEMARKMSEAANEKLEEYWRIREGGGP